MSRRSRLEIPPDFIPDLSLLRQVYWSASQTAWRSVTVKDNWTLAAYQTRPDPAGTWTDALECGRSYLVGESVPMSRFMQTHRSRLVDWQKVAFAWCRANPSQMLIMEDGKQDWQIYARGDHVEFVLPYHDAGGERAYITKDGRSKILINVD